MPRLAWLSLLLPVACGLQAVESCRGLPVFAACALSIIGLVTLVTRSTESIATYSGAVVGGLLNATFGNVAELVIAVLALRAGMLEVVRASITGSILGNVLFVSGLSMCVGGVRYKRQIFPRGGASTSLLLLTLSLIGLVTPTIIHMGPMVDASLTQAQASVFSQEISVVVACVLLLMYGLSLLFSLRTHRFVFQPEAAEDIAEDSDEAPAWSLRTSALVLLVVMLAVTVASELFVEALQHMLRVQRLPVSELFVGMVIVAVVGNAAEAGVAVSMAWRDKMGLAFQVSLGAAIQIAMLTAPLLVLVGLWSGHPLPLVFNLFELMALGSAVVIAELALQDGESNWFEGAMFLAVYAIFALVFWYHP